MLIADNRRQSLSTIPVSELVHYLTGANQQTFVRLRLALGLNLRRQLLIAVCDDLALRNAMAEKLAHDLPRLQDLSSFIPLEIGMAGRSLKPRPSDNLLTLTLHPHEAASLGQVIQQLKRDRQPPRFGTQILGIEQLTRQPVHIQRAFLNHLRLIGKDFARLDTNLLLWVTRPWWRSIQQSAPEFWRWRTGVFEFEGDPQPAAMPMQHPAILERPHESQAERQPDPIPAAMLLPVIQSTIAQLNRSEPIAAPVEAPTEPIVQPVAPIEPPIEPMLPAMPLTIPNLPPVEPQPVFGWAATQAPVELTVEAAVEALDETPIETILPAPAAAPELSHLEPSDEELALADLVLAAVMHQVSNDPGTLLQQSDKPNLDHPTFEPIRILQQVEDLQQQAAPAAEFALVYRELGDYYRNHHDAMLQTSPETAGKHLQVGIHAYDVAWKFLEPNDSAISEIHNDVANLYWMLSRTPGEVEQSLTHLETAIARYNQAIDLLDETVHPYTYAMLHSNIGAAYSDLAVRQDPLENLQRSIQSYETALQYRPAEADPRRYAATQNNLGTAFWNLGQHESLVLNLQRAIRAYTEALKIYDPEAEPLHYAMIQNNLGTAYWNLAQCDLDSDDPNDQLDAMPEDLLRLAIGAYRVALIYRTEDVAPAAHAATQNNLGTAYWHLANQPSTHPTEIQGYVLQAIAAYEAALNTARSLNAPLSFDLSATHNNLASAYYQAATNRHAQLDADTQGIYLTAALEEHLAALPGWEADSELYEAAVNGVAQVVRTIQETQGSPGQTLALSKLPPNVLVQVMKLV